MDHSVRSSDADNDASPEESGEQRPLFLRSADYERLSRVLPRNGERAEVVQALIDATGALELLDVEEVEPATARELQCFHSRDFVTALQKAHRLPRDDLEMYGLIDDCEAVPSLFDIVRLEAGGSLQAARRLVSGTTKLAIWWGGGRHHAAGNTASGFCYSNDVVIAILAMLDEFPRIMYVDIDVHHGDGVEEAFALSDQVLSISFHHHAPLFFPGTGGLDIQGGSEGRRAVINVPLREGCSDATFTPLFRSTLHDAAAAFSPDAIVLQCGADSLHGDPLGCFNLSPAAYTAALEDCRSLGKPLLVLGGGGYNVPNVARCWAALTLAAARAPMPSDIPAHERFEFYAPDFRFALLPGYRRNENDEGYIAQVRAAVAQAVGSLRARDRALSGSPEPTSQPDAPGAEVARDAGSDQDACAQVGLALGSATGAEPRRAEPSDSAAMHRGCGNGAQDAGGGAARALTAGCVDAGGCGGRCVARDALGASGWTKDLSAKAAPGWERLAKTARLGEPDSSIRAVELVK